jgi:hypothetical protein
MGKVIGPPIKTADKEWILAPTNILPRNSSTVGEWACKLKPEVCSGVQSD